MKTPPRTIDTMDAKDWIILRLLRVCARADTERPRFTSDFTRTVFWASNNFDMNHCTPVQEALHADIKRQDAADRYIYKQWTEPTDLDSLVPFEALLTSVQTNDA